MLHVRHHTASAAPRRCRCGPGWKASYRGIRFGLAAFVLATGLVFLNATQAIGSAAADTLRLGFTVPFKKVFFETPTNPDSEMANRGSIQMARNEQEAVQLVLIPETDLSAVRVTVSDLKRTDGAATIAADAVQVNIIAYVNLGKTEVAGSRLGWHPDPLLPNQALDLRKRILQPYLITVRTQFDTPPGTYTGEVVVTVGQMRLKHAQLRVEVWDFSLPEVSAFKTASLTEWGRLTKAWPTRLGYTKPSWRELKKRFIRLADLGFRNRLPPLAYLANGLRSYNWKGKGVTRVTLPTHDASGRFNRERTDEMIDYLLSKGGNHFFIALTSDIYRFPDQAPARQTVLLDYLREYTEHLRRRGLLPMAYIYNVDEPWGKAVEHARTIYSLIKKELGSDIRIMQNTNQNNDRIIGEFLGYFDALDINLGFYSVTRAAEYRAKHPGSLDDFWWNLNLWPRTRPNLFIEYPLVDARIIGLLSYRYRMQGFEYWDLISLSGIEGYHPLQADEIRVGWRVVKGSLDGTLVYPGADFQLYSSLRLESFRDGMEDQEYLYLLEKYDPDSKLLEVPVVRSITGYSEDPAEILGYRKQLGERLNRLTTAQGH